MTELNVRAGETSPGPGWYWFRRYPRSQFDDEWVMVRVWADPPTDDPEELTTDRLLVWVARPTRAGSLPEGALETWPEGDWAGPLTPPPLVRRSCPYCGGRRLKRVSEGDRHYLECQDCGGRGPGTREKTLAAVSWDHRPRESRS